MGTCDGISLTEVLVSLLLVTSASLALLKQQWHVSQLANQLSLQNSTLLQLDNATEQLLAKHPFEIDAKFHLTYKKNQYQALISVSRPSDLLTLQRKMVVSI